MKNIIFVSGLLLFFIFTSGVQACASPVFKNQYGAAISPFGGYFTVNSNSYPSGSLQATYNLKVQNLNDQTFYVSLIPNGVLQNYVSAETISVPANSEVQMPLQVWIGGNNVVGKLDVEYVCDNGQGNTGGIVFPTYMYIIILGNGISPPPVSTCQFSSTLNGCYQGLYRAYSCVNGALTYKAQCSNFCCSSYGGSNAFCSTDKQTCFTEKDLPPPTQGKIAFLCKDSKCSAGNEQSVIFLLRMLEWDVTYKDYKTWSEQELTSYDMIACSDENQACKVDFNSPAYNAHTEDGIAFLEITGGTTAKAAYSFGYVTAQSARVYKDNFVVVGNDPITAGYSGAVNVINSNQFPTIDDSKLTSEAIDLGDSGTHQSSMMFKVNPSPAHGKYAYVDWFYKAGVSALTTDGETILNRTLLWLKNHVNYPTVGNVAFLCEKDLCSKSSEMNMIKFLRSNSYSVTGKATKSWSASELNNYDIMICSSTTSCKISGMPAEDAHLNSKKGFIEIPDSSGAVAAYTFGYTNSRNARSASVTSLIINSTFAGFSAGQTPAISLKSSSVAGVNIGNLVSGTDIAHPYYYRVTSFKTYTKEYPYSTEFVSDASGNKGRYAYIGWVGKTAPNALTSDGQTLLLRTINWVKCGKNSC